MIKLYLLLICVLICSIHELKAIQVDKHNSLLTHTHNKDYGCERNISKGHMELNHNEHIITADFGSYNSPMDIDEIVGNGGSGDSNRRRAEYQKLRGHNSRGVHLWKTTDIVGNPDDRIFYPSNEGISFSQYVKLEWKRSWSASLGQTFKFFASTRGELHQDQVFKKSLSEENRRGETSLFPQTGIDWSGPSVPVWKNNIVFQPSGKLILAPRQAIGNEAHPILGEGSENFGVHAVPHDNDLLGANQFSGNDGMNAGSHTVYGGKILTTFSFLGNATLFLGQKYALSKSNKQNDSKGRSSPFSDYVGYIEVNPLSWLMLEYRFSFKRKSLKHGVSKIGGSIGYPIASLSGSYVVTRNIVGINNEKNFNKSSQHINLFFSSQLTNNWSFMSSFMEDLQKKQKEGGGGQYGVGAHYNDKNFAAGFTINRQFYPNMDLKPEITYMLTFGFNTAGEYISPTNLNQGEQSTAQHLFLRP